jgi:hypothetical protein
MRLPTALVPQWSADFSSWPLCDDTRTHQIASVNSNLNLHVNGPPRIKVMVYIQRYR